MRIIHTGFDAFRTLLRDYYVNESLFINIMWHNNTARRIITFCLKFTGFVLSTVV